jgi:predicted AlkP superfamily phosphohydrolase/phosphomutase
LDILTEATRDRREASNPRVLIIGLDGATLDLIIPWAGEGKLPAFQRMIEEGAIGELRSTIQPLTAPAWVSFMTGMNPGNHGIYDFIRRKPNSYDVELVYAGNLQRNTLWTLLSEKGKHVGAINMPMTYPPNPVNGFLISGIDTPGPGSPLTYPRELYDELKSSVGEYIIAVSGNSQEEWAAGFRSMVTNRTEVFDYLRKNKPWDCLMVVYSATDMSQHVFWRNMEGLSSSAPSPEDKKYGGLILEIYQSIDSMLGALLDEVEEETTILIMSDHGAGPIKRAVYMNRWLEEQGWLVRRDSTQEAAVVSWGLNLSRGILRRALFAGKKYLPHRARGWLKRSLPGVRDSIEGFMLSSLLDWSRTKAFSVGSYGNIYLNLKGREPQGTVDPGSEAEELCGRIVEGLEDLRDPVTADRVVEAVHRKHELYWGQYVERAPDLIVQWKNYEYDCRQRFGAEERAVFGEALTFNDLQDAQTMSAVHRLHGTLMLWGNPVRRARRIEGAQIIDLAPTILYLLGQPVPKSMDGRVLTEALDEQYVSSHPIAYVDDLPCDGSPPFEGYTDEESKAVSDRLRGLGYLQ